MSELSEHELPASGPPRTRSSGTRPRQQDPSTGRSGCCRRCSPTGPEQLRPQFFRPCPPTPPPPPKPLRPAQTSDLRRFSRISTTTCQRRTFGIARRNCILRLKEDVNEPLPNHAEIKHNTQYIWPCYSKDTQCRSFVPIKSLRL